MESPERESLPVESGRSFWTADDVALLLKLRLAHKSWEEIAVNFPGRTTHSCRARYRRIVNDPMDEKMKYRLATLYESRKEKMWAKVAEGMNVPWTEAEQNHWILGKKEMKKRAGDPDFRESWQKDYVALESKTNDDSNLAGLAPPLVDNAEDEVSAHEEQGRIQSVAWTGKEESSLFDLRAAGKCWNYISNLLPGRRRTVRSCMSHYRHVRDRAGGWSPELQTDLSRLYQIHKSEMWAELAEQLAVPWQSAEATHWILGSDYIGERAFLPQTVEPDQPAANPHELQPPNLTDSEPFDNSWATLILDRD